MNIKVLKSCFLSIAAVLIAFSGTQSFAQGVKSAHPVAVPAGVKQQLVGIVSIREGDRFKLRDPSGAEPR